MRKMLLAAVCLLALAGLAGRGAGFGPIGLGFHLSPSVETQEGQRAWDLSLSLGVTFALDEANAVEFLGIVDSGPTALGTTLTFRSELTDHASLGGGVTALWPIMDGTNVRTPLFGSFIVASLHDAVGGGLSTEASASLPFLTVAKRTDRWAIFPLAELPSVAIAADIRLNQRGFLELQATFQPVITDTTTLVDPIGRVTDDLLILPMFSAFTKYVP